MKIYCAPIGGGRGSAAAYRLLEHAFMTEFGGGFPEIKKTENGKPYFPEYPEIHFSLSHAKTHVLCAIGNAPVGVDIESPRVIGERLANYFASVDELALFDPLDLWVLKESYVKLLGLTVMAVRKIHFSREGERIIAPDPAARAKLYRIAGCTAAICTLGSESPETIELVGV